MGQLNQFPTPLLDTPAPLQSEEDSFKQIAKDAKKRARDSIRNAMAVSAQLDPDQVAKQAGLSRQTGIPASALIENPEQAKQLAQSQAFSDEQLDRMAEDFPIFVQRLTTDPSFAAMVQDDIPHTSGFEGILDDVKAYYGDLVGAGARGITNYELGILGSRRVLAVMQGGDLPPEAVQRILSLQEAVQGPLQPSKERGFIVGTPITVAEQLPNILGSLGADLVGRTVGRGVVGGVSALTALVAGQAGPQAATPEEVVTVPAAAGVGAGVGGTIGGRIGVFLHSAMLEGGLAMVDFSSIRDENGNAIDLETAANFALLTGIINGSFESLSFTRLKKVLPAGIGDRAIAREITLGMRRLIQNPTTRKRIIDALKRQGASSATETITEGLQEATLIAFEELSKVMDKSAFEDAEFSDLFEPKARRDMIKQIFGAAGAGFQVATFLGLPTTGRRVATARRATAAAGPSIAETFTSAPPPLPTQTPAVEVEEGVSPSPSPQPPPLPRSALDIGTSETVNPEIKAATKALLHDVAEVDEVARDQRLLDALPDFAQKSKLHERSPAMFSDFITEAVNNAVGNDALRHVRITGTALEAHFQEFEGARERFETAVPGLGEQLAQAVAVGGDVLVPFGDYAAYIAPTDSHTAIRGDLKLRQGASTSREVLARTRDVQNEFGRLFRERMASNEDVDATDQVFEALKTGFATQIERSGRVASKKATDTSAAIIASAVQTMAARSPFSVQEFARKLGPTILGDDTGLPPVTPTPTPTIPTVAPEATEIEGPETLAPGPSPAPTPVEAETTQLEDVEDPSAATPESVSTTVPIPEETDSNEPGTVNPAFPVDDIEIDPKRFQFKLSATAEGTTGSLSDVETFDPDLAGIIQVYREPDTGRVFVVNGHNRVALAKRAKAQGQENAETIPVRFLDVESEAEARAVGALTNIAEGRGTSLDAAKFFRDTGLTREDLEAKGIGLRQNTAAEGLALSALAPAAFNAVIEGDLTPKRGAMIGGRISDHNVQLQLLDEIQREEGRGRRVNDATVSNLIDQINAVPTSTEQQETLFGEETVVQSIAFDRARLAAGIRARLGKDKRLFGLVSKNAAALERGRNIIDPAKSAEVSGKAAQLLAIFDSVKDTKGTVSDILNRGAQRLAEGENAQTVNSETYDELREALPAIISRAEGPSAERGPGDTGDIEDAGTERIDQTEPLFQEAEVPPPPVHAAQPYSATLRAVELSPQSKASGEQWLGMLRKQPGVRQEEIEFLDLPDFLEGKKSVTRQELADDIGLNRVRLHQVGNQQTDIDTQVDFIQAHAEHEWAEPDGDVWKEVRDKLWNDHDLDQDREFLLQTFPDRYRNLLVPDKIDRDARERAEETIDQEMSGLAIYTFVEEGYRIVEDPTEQYELNRFTVERENDGGWVWIEDLDHYDRAVRAIVNDMIENGETTLGTRHLQFTVPGGVNYREELLVWENAPSGVSFVQKDHFNEENVVAFFRSKDRTFEVPQDPEALLPDTPAATASVEALALEEFQSDWHQQGRAGGFIEPDDAAELKRVNDRYHELARRRGPLFDTLGGKYFEAIKRGDIGEKRVIDAFQLALAQKIELDTRRAGPFRAPHPLAELDVSEEAELAARGRRESFEGLEIEGALDPEFRKQLLQDVQVQVAGTFVDNDPQLKKLDAELNDVNERRVLLQNRVPSAPFRNTWHEVVLKHALIDAVNNGKDALAWTPGIVHVTRWKRLLEETVQRVDWELLDTGEYRIVGVPFDDSVPPIEQIVRDKDLPGLVGVANAKTIAEATEREGRGSIAGVNLKVPKAFLINLYDEKAVQYMKKLGKIHQGQVEKRTDPEGMAWWYFEIPEGLKEVIRAEGLPLFQAEEAGPPGPRNIRGVYLPDERIVQLTKDANLSTIMHEVGHWYLHTLNELSQIEGAAPDVREDLFTIFSWLGVSDFKELTREDHEIFADGFLKYLSEGKPPTPRMVAAFQRFRSWLMALYRTGELQRMGGIELPEDVRDVFDRMLATDEEVADARHEAGARAIFVRREDATEMTDKEWDDYVRNRDEIVESATRMRDEVTVRRANRKQTTGYKKRLGETKKAVRKEIEEEPAFRAKRYLLRGELPDGEIEEHHKLDSDAVLLIFRDLPDGSDILGRLPFGKHSIDTNVNGLDPDYVAELFGFASGEAMIRAVVDFSEKNIDRRVNEEATARLETEGVVDPSLDPTSEAMEALHNEGLENMLLAEIEVFERRSGQRGIPVRRLKAFASGEIAETAVGDIKPEVYLGRERKQGQLALQATIRGNYEAAADARRRQLLNMYLYKEARDKTKKISRILAEVKRYRRPRTRLAIGADYIEQIDDILGRFDFRVGTPFRTEKTQTLGAFINAQRELGKPVRIDTDVVGEHRGRTTYKALTMGELEGIHEALRNIEMLGRQETEIRIGEQRRRVDEIRMTTIETLEKNLPGGIFEVTGNTGRFTAVKHGLLAIHAHLRRMSHLFRTADGGNTNGAMWNTWMRPAEEAGNRKFIMQRELYEKLRAIIGDYSAHQLRRRIRIEGTDNAVSFEELLCLALNWGNEENRGRILELGDNAPGLNALTIPKLLDTLSKKDWENVQGVWDLLDSMWPEVEALERRTTGGLPKRVTPTQVKTRHGTFRGGYYPIKYDPRASAKTEQRALEQTAEQVLSQMGALAHAQTRQGHIQTRVGSGGQKLRMKLDVIAQHINDVVHDVTHRELIMMYVRLLRDAPTANAMQQSFGPEMFREFERWVTRVANTDRIETDTFQRLIGHMRGGVAASVMGWKVSVAMQQPLGMSQSVVRIGPKAMGVGLGHTLRAIATGEIGTLMKDIHGRSEFMQNRSERINREVDELFRKLHKNNALSSIELSMFYFIQKAQATVDVPTWVGEYNKQLALGVDEKDAAALADRAVNESQGSGAKKDLSAVEVGTQTKKLFTTFYSFFNTTYNLTADSIARVRFQKDPFAIPKLASDLLLLYTIPALLGELILDRGPDDDEDWVTWALREQLFFLAATIPLVRDIGSAFEFGREAPAGLATGRLANLMKQISQGEADLPLLKSVLEVAAIVGPLHFPATQINTTMQGYIDLKEGKTENPMALLIRTKDQRN